MKYFLDTEFNGFGGALISLALYREDGNSIYLRMDTNAVEKNDSGFSSFVKENVLPNLNLHSNFLTSYDFPYIGHGLTYGEIGDHIHALIKGDDNPIFICDYPDDIQYCCKAISMNGVMINIDKITFEMNRVDVYPTTLPGAVRHNAWWDAKALFWYYKENGLL